MNEAVERMHALSQLVLFLMLFMMAIAIMSFGTPTGLVAGNQTGITTQGLVDLKPFLTAVGLLMALFVAVVAAFNAFATPRQEPAVQENIAEKQQASDLDAINKELAKIRNKLKR